MPEDLKIVYPVGNPLDDDVEPINPDVPASTEEVVVDTQKDVVSVEGVDYVLDDKGNALNETGGIVFTKDQIDAKNATPIKPVVAPVVESEQVEIENVVYTLDKDGNAVLDGKIVYTKEQLASAQAVSDNVIVSLKSELNIVPADDTGKEIEYSDDTAGLTRYVNDVVDIMRAEGADEAINSLFTNIPSMREAYLYAQSHNGSLDGFTPSIDYKSMEITAETKELNTNLIVEAEIARGKSRDEALRIAKYYENDGITFEEAKKAKDYLDGVREKRVADYQTSIIEQEREAAIEAQEFWGVGRNDKNQLVALDVPDSVYTKVKSGVLKVGDQQISLPETIRVKENGSYKNYTREQFFAYMFTPQEVVIKGEKQVLTGYQLDQMMDNQRKTKDDFIFEAFTYFVKNDESQIINKIIEGHEVKKAKQIRKLTFGSSATPVTSQDTQQGKGIAYPVK